MEQQYLFLKCIEDIKKIIKDNEDFLQRNYLLMNRNDFMNRINNCLNAISFDTLKSQFKEFSELISTIQNWADRIKNIKEKINSLITQYENFRDSSNFIEILKENEEKIIFEGYIEFCDEKISNDNSNPKKEIKNKKKQLNDFYYYYSISFCSNIYLNNDSDFNSIIKELKYSNSYNKMFLSKIHKNIYLNNIIKSKKFEDNNIISKYAYECPKINDIKLLEEFLIKKCNIKKQDLDYRGNAIYFNLSQNNKRGQERYDPPHGCICLGLKCIGKYENDDWLNNNSESSKWAIAYHGIGNLSMHKDIKAMIFNIIKDGLKPGNSQAKIGLKDKRHPKNKIKEGVYLYPTFKNAEENSGIIYINNKKYKIILMARVLIEKISEPEDAEQWILKNEDIRVYRILAKMIE